MNKRPTDAELRGDLGDYSARDLAEALLEAREALRWFLGDPRFAVSVGGNPNVVAAMITKARGILGDDYGRAGGLDAHSGIYDDLEAAGLGPQRKPYTPPYTMPNDVGGF